MACDKHNIIANCTSEPGSDTMVFFPAQVQSHMIINFGAITHGHLPPRKVISLFLLLSDCYHLILGARL